MAVLEPRLADPRRDRLRPRHRRAAASSRDGVNALRAPDRSILLVTHYQRLLDYVSARRRPRHGGRPHRQLRRAGARRRAGEDRLRAGRRHEAGGRRRRRSAERAMTPARGEPASALFAGGPRGPAGSRDGRGSGAAALPRRRACPPRATRTGASRASRRSRRARSCRAPGRGGRRRAPARGGPRSPPAGRGSSSSTAGCARSSPPPAALPRGASSRRPGARAGPSSRSSSAAASAGTRDAERHAFAALNPALMEDGGFSTSPRAPCWRRRSARLPRRPGARPGSRARARWSSPARAPRATIAEHWLGGEGVYLTNGVAELFLGDGAQVEHCSCRTSRGARFHVGVVFAEQGAGSSLAAHALSLGAGSRGPRSTRASPASGARSRERPLHARRPAALRRPLGGRARGAALQDDRELQGDPRRPLARRLRRAHPRAARGAEDRRAPEELQPAPLRGRDRRHQAAARDLRGRREVRPRRRRSASSTRPRSSTCARAASTRRRRAGSSSTPSRARWWTSSGRRRCGRRRDLVAARLPAGARLLEAA